MKPGYLIVAGMLSVAICACQQPEPMNITVKERSVLKEIPSVSGIERIGDELWLLSDNSPWVHVLDTKARLIKKLAITDDTLDLEDGVIPKVRKHDMEAMFTFKRGESTFIMLLGSGSRKNRMEAKEISVNGSLEYVTYDLTPFYSLLMEKTSLDPDELNIEAATVADDELFLFNRDKNKVVKMKLTGFLDFIGKKTEGIKMKVYTLELPSLGGIRAGFSGAATTDDGKKILFTASVENTSDWVQDGEVLGSMIGFIPLDRLKDGFEPECITLHDKGERLLIKVESIVVTESMDEKHFDCLLVTDSDGGASELLRVSVSER